MIPTNRAELLKTIAKTLWEEAEPKRPGRDGDPVWVVLPFNEEEGKKFAPSTWRRVHHLAERVLAGIEYSYCHVVPDEVTPDMFEGVAANSSKQIAAYARAAWSDLLEYSPFKKR